MNITQMTSITKVKAFSLILLACLVVYLSIKMFNSSLYALQTDLFLSDWQNKASSATEITFTPDNQAWLNANQAAEHAINAYPTSNAFLQESAGKVYQWQTYSQPYGDENSTENRLKALQAFREQTLITPKWPKAWLNLLSIKIELGQYDQEFYNAFNMARTTANQNPEVSTQFTLLSIQAWSNLNNPTKSKVLRMIINEASLSKNNSQNLKPLLQAYELLTVSCIYAKAIKENTFELCK